MKLPVVSSIEDLAELVEDVGFLPFFKNEIEGFSLSECAAREVWFPEKGEGVWEWKGPVIKMTGCAYGKFFKNKAGFISARWFTDFANWRRYGYDMDALYDDGMAKKGDLQLWQLLCDNAPIVTGQLKKIGNYKKGGATGFDAAITRLQMRCYATISDFPYRTDKNGKIYGWGETEYTTPELLFGESFTDNVYTIEPQQSYDKIMKYLTSRFPDTDFALFARLLTGGVQP